MSSRKEDLAREMTALGTYDCVAVHVGTHNTCLDSVEVLDKYARFFVDLMRRKQRTKVVVSSILPRGT